MAVDAYLDSVREIERRLQLSAEKDTSGLEIPEAPIGVPNDIDTHFKMMFDLMALAFQADVTRVITFSMDREASMRTYNNLSINEAFHPLSHHSNDPAKQDRLAVIQNYHTKMFAHFIDRMAKTQDGDGTLARPLDDHVRQQHERQQSPQPRSVADRDPGSRARPHQRRPASALPAGFDASPTCC